MKTTIVPAQVTTVEDKIAGNLSFTQLLLLTTPVFLDGALFVIMPPLFKLTPLKLSLGIILAFMFMMLAIRIKGKLLIQWIAVIARYRLRPRFYLFNKNDLYLRNNQLKPIPQPIAEKPEDVELTEYLVPSFIPTPEMVRLETAVADPRAKFHLRTEKGALRVYIHEVKEESI